VSERNRDSTGMDTRRTPNDMESAYPSRPTHTKYRTRRQETEIYQYDSEDSETDSVRIHRRKKKRKTIKLVIMNLLLITGLGIAITTCYIYGPWRASHVRAYYTSSKLMSMECWTAEEQSKLVTADIGQRP